MFAEGLRCVVCHLETDLGGYFFGCRDCGSALETVYDEDRVAAAVSYRDWRDRADRSIWRYRELLPVREESAVISLGEGRTPLVLLPRSDANPVADLWIQNETVNPTYSFKDRFHSVAQSMARQLGYRRVACSTTGNHGMSAAAYAARGGLQCAILVDPRAPEVQRRWMRLFGATVIVEMDRRPPLESFVRDHGWYPSTYMTPNPVATPYGMEGYKTMAYDAVLALGRVPDHYIVPIAAGDGLYGPWKAFGEMARLGWTDSIPKVHGVQPTAANPIVRAFREGSDTVPYIEDPQTIALSIGDPTGGSMTLRAMRESGGQAIDLTDPEMVAATRYAASAGLSPEPSSAASLAGAWALARDGIIREGETVVCLFTGAGPKWPETTAQLTEGDEIVSPDSSWLERLARDPESVGVT
ncbi:threonine synthase [Candidatus Spongiisocius sp.]|uniref:threonine synthase n=1 Tax=Candidatus Spongiisocius sp. TaxID=3101273 RepID=UPI003B5CECDB